MNLGPSAWRLMKLEVAMDSSLKFVSFVISTGRLSEENPIMRNIDKGSRTKYQVCCLMYRTTFHFFIKFKICLFNCQGAADP